MTRTEFLSNSLEVSGATFLFYSPLCLWRLYEDGSVIFLLILILLLLIHFPIALLTSYKNLSLSTILCNTCIAYGILTSIMFFFRATEPVAVINGAVAFLMLLYLGLITLCVKRKKKGKQHTSHVIKKRCLKVFKTIYAFASCFLIIIVAVGQLKGRYHDNNAEDIMEPIELYITPVENSLLNTSSEESKKTNSEVPYLTVEDCYDDLKVFLYWNESSFEERFDAIQCIANVLSDELRLPKRLEVNEVFLGWLSNVSAYYSHEDGGEIFINELRIMQDSDEENDMGLRMLNTVIHECFHCFQYRIVELLPVETRKIVGFEKADIYEKELEHYITDDFEEYAAQNLEIDSNAFAEQRANEIYDELKDIQKKRGEVT